MKLSIFLIIFSTTYLQSAQSVDYSYEEIAKRYPKAKLTSDNYNKAKMEGECLVGLKELNFKKQTKFDAVAEWTNYRSISLLKQFPPCTVLVMLEVAKSKLEKNGNTK